MTTLQIRTRKGMNLEDLVSELARGILESVKRELDSSEAPFESYRSLEGALRTNLSPCVRSYDRCGTEPVCSKGIVERVDFFSNDRIYIFQSEQDLNSLLEKVTAETLHFIRLFLDPQTAEALHRRVKAGLFGRLSPYIYSNPFCGNHEVCTHSVKLNPWINR